MTVEEQGREDDDDGRWWWLPPALAMLVPVLAVAIAWWTGGGEPVPPPPPRAVPVTERTIFDEGCGQDEQCVEVFYASARALPRDASRGAHFADDPAPAVTLGRAVARVPVILPDDFAGNEDRYCRDVIRRRKGAWIPPICKGERVAARRLAEGGYEVQEEGPYTNRQEALRPEDEIASVTGLWALQADTDPGVKRSYARLREALDAAMDPDRPALLLYVHGFNTGFERGIVTAAHLKADLEAQGARGLGERPAAAFGVPVAYSWPTLTLEGTEAMRLEDRAQVSNLAYLESQLRAEAASEDLARLFEEAARTRVREVNVVAHSMGNRLLIRAMAPLFGEVRNARGEPVTVRIVHAAADVGKSDFADALAALPRDGRAPLSRSTVYVSSADEALGKSVLAQQTKRALRDELTEEDGPFSQRVATLREKVARQRRDRGSADASEVHKLVAWPRMRALLARPGTDAEAWFKEDSCRVGRMDGSLFGCGMVPRDRPDVEVVDVLDFETDSEGHSYFEHAAMVVADMACALSDVPLDTGERSLTPPGRRGEWRLVASPAGAESRLPACHSTGRLLLVTRTDPPPGQPDAAPYLTSLYFDARQESPICAAPVDNDAGAPPGRGGPCAPAGPALAAIVATAAQLDDPQVIVAGYADRAYDEGYNLVLSERRARAVAGALLAAGLPRGALGSVEGRGETPSVGPERRDRRNRRVDVTVRDLAD